MEIRNRELQAVLKRLRGEKEAAEMSTVCRIHRLRRRRRRRRKTRGAIGWRYLPEVGQRTDRRATNKYPPNDRTTYYIRREEDFHREQRTYTIDICTYLRKMPCSHGLRQPAGSR